MLSYNDALVHQPPAFSECAVCKDLVSDSHIIWHEIKLHGTWPVQELLVPICIDCADLFHDVKPERSS